MKSRITNGWSQLLTVVAHPLVSLPVNNRLLRIQPDGCCRSINHRSVIYGQAALSFTGKQMLVIGIDNFAQLAVRSPGTNPHGADPAGDAASEKSRKRGHGEI